MDPNNIDNGQLRELIKEHFTLEDLKSLCFDLNINFEDLPGTNLDAKARELIAFCKRNGHIEELIKKLQIERSHINWSDRVILTNQIHPSSFDEDSSTQNEQPTTNNGNGNPIFPEWIPPKTHLGKIIFINIIFVIVGSYTIAPLVRETYFSSATFCSPDNFINYSLSAFMIFVLHIVWHVVSPPLGNAAPGGNIAIAGINISVGPVQSIIDSIHPWKLPEPIFWGIIITGLVASLIAQSPWSPINRLAATPSIAHFSIDNGLLILPVGVPLQLQPGQSATVEAVIGALPGSVCTWRTQRGGVLTRIDGCTVTYTLPSSVNNDYLEVKITSTCTRYALTSGLHMINSGAP